MATIAGFLTRRRKVRDEHDVPQGASSPEPAAPPVRRPAPLASKAQTAQGCPDTTQPSGHHLPRQNSAPPQPRPQAADGRPIQAVQATQAAQRTPQQAVRQPQGSTAQSPVRLDGQVAQSPRQPQGRPVAAPVQAQPAKAPQPGQAQQRLGNAGVPRQPPQAGTAGDDVWQPPRRPQTRSQ
jgi:hypothetical protein